jgi:ABC-type uncharacterized transport system ATPase subunit
MTDLRLEGITKRFGSFVANYNISLSIQAGTIHALLGENGAGKSTLMNILCGLYQPDAGQIYVSDRPVRLTSASVAIQQGIGMVHQHFMLIPQLSVTENIILGTNLKLNLNLSQKAEEIAALSRSYGLDVNPYTKIEDLPLGAQQRVEILKVLYRKATVLILDEPTAVLTPLEVESLFIVLRQLAHSGHTIIFISHKLDEVMTLCDAVTVLRRGEVVTTTSPHSTTHEALAELVIGRKIVAYANRVPCKLGAVTLDVQNLRVEDSDRVPVLADISFQLRAGEILGISGVDGNGQRELADAIAGLQPISQGKVAIDGQEVTQWSAQQRMQRLKIGYIPEDRQTMGLVLSFSIAQNLILKLFNRVPFCYQFILRFATIHTFARTAIEQFNIRAEHSSIKVGQLSGGNQQKVVLARELAKNPSLIIAMQATRGLDIGATEAVHQRLLAERLRGAAILYSSTELDELFTLCDRIGVMRKGKLVDILKTTETTPTDIGLLMVGGRLADRLMEIAVNPT